MEVKQLLHERLTNETRWILAVLLEEKRFIAKEELWKLVNEQYKTKKNMGNDLIKTRHFLDTYMNRLEGAALVDVQEIGRIRLYEITMLGEEVLTFKIV